MKPLDLPWLRPSAADIHTEMTQCREEGKNTASLEDQAEKLKKLDFSDDANIALVDDFYDAAAELPQAAGYAYNEPSDLEGIRALRKGSGSITGHSLSADQLLEKAHGAWLGRISGCMLGKPVECKRSHQIKKYLEAQGRWPLTEYFSIKAEDDLRKECGMDSDWSNTAIESISGSVADDDTNYTTVGLAIIKAHGRDFTPNDVADFWIKNIPAMYTCTAERIAYRNLLNLLVPPVTATYRNPYREWIGAQIRADFWGYVCPADTARAAEYAFRDASISHVKNGIYGEMWVAAMLAAAYTTDDLEAIVRAGLSEIPSTSRLHESIEAVIEQYHNGLSYEEAFADLRKRWDEAISHDWCHTISNAMIVTISLLWGAKDFTKTIAYSVMPGFDTDCNGATVGSVLGMVLGSKAIPAQWTEPLKDTLRTDVAGYREVKISDIAKETVDLILR